MVVYFLKYWKPAGFALAIFLAVVWGDNHGAERIQAKWDAEKAQQVEDKLKGASDAKKIRENVGGMSDIAVNDELQKWFRD